MKYTSTSPQKEEALYDAFVRYAMFSLIGRSWLHFLVSSTRYLTVPFQMLGYSCALMLFCGLTLGKVVMNTELDAEWNQYKKSYNKTYSERDETLRRQIWEENLRYIEQHNEQADKGKHTYWLGMNEYGDMM
ncbi:hypothetical protein KUTeg_000559 [Tegillarca granosa]|uniref:Cathepsin propeptide inhibitor domain-containing protein n=1 Tax=Tegillarca granosa TaxID=220873 RepID=A0ABQ9FXV8_TEGGR|nr:hypothetical protein KUTeg_000559 [Tegillarca granosa]